LGGGGNIKDEPFVAIESEDQGLDAMRPLRNVPDYDVILLKDANRMVKTARRELETLRRQTSLDRQLIEASMRQIEESRALLHRTSRKPKRSYPPGAANSQDRVNSSDALSSSTSD
jgi:hypothetical protein